MADIPNFGAPVDESTMERDFHASKADSSIAELAAAGIFGRQTGTAQQERQ